MLSVFSQPPGLFVLAGIALVCCLAIGGVIGLDWAIGISAALPVAAMTFSLGDKLLENSRALPNGAATVNSTGIDLASGVTGSFLAGCEFLIEAPVLTTGQLADTQTMKYSIQHAADAAFTSPVTEADLITQTGASGAGAAAATKRWRPPTNVGSFVRLRIIKSGAGDASAATAYLKLLF